MDEVLFVAPPLTIYRTPNGWVYSSFTGMDGKANDETVAIVPYRHTDGESQILIYAQEVPAWGKGMYVTSITGAVDEKDESIYHAAARELYEESGYRLDSPDPQESLMFVGRYKQGKATNTTVSVFAVDLTGYPDPEKPTGDGSEFEDRAQAFWNDVRQLIDDEGYDMPLALVVSKYFE